MARLELTQVPGIGAVTAERLRAIGIDDVAALATHPVDEVAALPGFHTLRAATVQAAARQLLGAAAEAAADLDPADRVMACAHAYRSWALDHPAEFNLVFTDRIPGYAAPPDGPTVEIQAEIFGPFVAALDALADAGTAAGTITPDDERVGLWATMHGFVMLEINHHLPFVDDHRSVFDATLRRNIAR